MLKLKLNEEMKKFRVPATIDNVICYLKSDTNRRYQIGMIDLFDMDDYNSLQEYFVSIYRSLFDENIEEHCPILDFFLLHDTKEDKKFILSNYEIKIMELSEQSEKDPYSLLFTETDRYSSDETIEGIMILRGHQYAIPIIDCQIY